MISLSQIQAKAAVLLEALPYIQRFHGSVFVVKYGGSFMDDPDPAVRGRVATDIAFLAAVGIRVVVVHGGGKAITRAMESRGGQARFERGFRVTDGATAEIVRRTLDEEINLDVCEMLQHARGRPLGLAGFKVFLAEKMTLDAAGEPIDAGFVGEVKQVHTRPVLKALEEGYIPVVSPVGADESGQPYNTNADVAAARLAAALRARRLVFMSDVPGLLRDPAQPDTLISSLPVSEVPVLRQSGVISAGMLPKVDSAVKALESGVNRVHFIDGRLPHSLLLEIFTDRGIGTEIVH